MLFAPPTHPHEDRLTRPRVCSPPQRNRSPPSPSQLLGSSLYPGSKAAPLPRRDTSPRPPAFMSNLSDSIPHYPPVTSSSAHPPSQRRSPQSTGLSSSSTPNPIERSGSGGGPSGASGGPPSGTLQPGMVPASSGSSTVTGSSTGTGPGSLVPSSGSVCAGSSSQTPPIHHPLLGYVPHGNKILSRNLNGTPAITAQPSNESELQLYRVLQRANLLNYFDTFISQGGDDVQQLCEAGEEEFLEIMALVGMASKPLHVRRLQKALQEWVSNPPLFQIPLVPNLPPSVVAGFPPFSPRGILGGGSNTTPTPPTRPSPPMTSSASSVLHNHNTSPGLGKENPAPVNSLGSCSPRDGGPPPTATPSREGASQMGLGACPPMGPRGPSPPTMNSSAHLNSNASHLPPTSLPLQNCQSSSVGGPEKNPEFFLQFMKTAGCESPGLSYPPPSNSPMGGSPGSGNSPQGVTPTLHEAQIARLAQSASELVANLPSLEPRKDAFNNKRKMSKELEIIMNMSEDDPRRMEELRKYAAIYGRFDCKRKPEKPLTLHEVSVNEAAAQICKYMPALLTRRDELFPLARQVVRDSGYQYSKGHSRSQTVIGREDEPRNKRMRTDSGAGEPLDSKQDPHWKKRQERLESISDELRAMSDKAEEVKNSLTSGVGNVNELTQQMDALQARHALLTREQSELLMAQQKSYTPRSRSERTNSEEGRNDDSDSQFSYSATNSPSSQVISSSHGNIIAVANPALSLSSTLTPNHSHMGEEDRLLPTSVYSGCQNSQNRQNSIKQEPNSPGNPHKQE